MKYDTSAMWTYARSSSIDSASSKSFAVSGSIVNAGRSRRSTRPSSVTGGGAYGSKSWRAPVSTSSASSTFSIRFAGPSTRSTRARPRVGRTATRSPGPASPSPFRSSTIDMPGVKYGSPTTSFPRRATSTTTLSGPGPSGTRSRDMAGRLDPQEAADRDARAGRPEEHAEPEQDERRPDELERVGVARVADVPEDRRQRDLPPEHEQNDREHGTRKARDQPLEHERPAHEPVRGADEL